MPFIRDPIFNDFICIKRCDANNNKVRQAIRDIFIFYLYLHIIAVYSNQKLLFT